MINNDTLLEDLNLSVRAYNCMNRAGYQTVGDVRTAIDRADGDVEQALGRVRNLGRRSIEELIDKIDIEPRIKTNFEVITESIEKAAKLLKHTCPDLDHKMECSGGENCLQCWINWLNSEAEEAV